MDRPHLTVARDDVLAFRLRSQGLRQRLPLGPDALRQAAWAGAQDSMPRAALLSLHARVADVGPSVLDYPSLVQVWGPRYNVYVVAASDVAVFTIGRLRTDPQGRGRAEEVAARAAGVLADRGEVRADEVGRALGGHPNGLAYAAPTGTLLLRWDGARQPRVRLAPPPPVDERDARHELVRRYLHVLGPAGVPTFARWAGVPIPQARTTFEELADALVPVRGLAGEGWWILAEDEAALRDASSTEEVQGVRLLPSGDVYWLLHDTAREVLVPDPVLRDRLWTPRVWPGALLLDGDVAGTWRRAGTILTVEPWRDLTPAEREGVAAAAADLPLPDAGAPTVVWQG